MGDKGKGKESGNGKKPKTTKAGHRPHEERKQQDAAKQVIPEPAKRG